MSKPREYLVLAIKGIYNTRAFIWPYAMKDRDWIQGWKRKEQEQVHVIEKSAYIELQGEADKLAEAIKQHQCNVETCPFCKALTSYAKFKGGDDGK